MSNWDTLWSFKTARFAVELACEHEQAPDVSWADAETLAKLESGEWSNYTFRVRVLLDGQEIGADYLGNSAYADPAEFATAHRSADPNNRNTLAMKARNTVICHYFPDMVTSAVMEARARLAELRSVRLRVAS